MSGNSVPFRNGRRTFVVDSWPLMEWLKEREPTVTRFDHWVDLARMGDIGLVLSTINFGEVYYNCWRLWDEEKADRVRIQLTLSPLQLRHPSEEDVLAAARLKARFRISYADAFTAVLAQETDAPVLTGDPDFLTLSQAGICAVEWLGA